MTSPDTGRQLRQRADINPLYELVERVDAKVDTLARTVDQRFENLERRVDGRFTALERQVDDRFTAVDGRMSSLDDKLERILELLVGR